jgi:hypothetical protein
VVVTEDRTWNVMRINELLDTLGVAPGPDPVGTASRLLAIYDEIVEAARAEADAIRQEARVTADGIVQIAREDTKDVGLELRVEQLERRVSKQKKKIERLENVLLGLAPGIPARRHWS